MFTRRKPAARSVIVLTFQSPKAFLTDAGQRSKSCRASATAVRFGWLDRFFHAGISRFNSSFQYRSIRRARWRMAVNGWRERLGVEGEFQRCLAAGAVGAVPQRKTASVAFGDLAAQQQADAGTAGLGGEEGHEEIAGVRDA